MQATLSITALGDISRPSFASDLPPTPLFEQATADETCTLVSLGLACSGGYNHSLGDRRHSLAEGRGLAHDAGNLLGALRLYCGLLARPGVLRAEHRHYADELLLLSGRSGSLISRLLEPQTAEARILAETGSAASADESGPPAPVSLLEVIGSCHGLLNTLTGRAIMVREEEGVAAYRIAGPRESLERILVNLSKNAAEASPSHGRITLRVSLASRRCQTHLVLSVEDEGCGMSAAGAAVLNGEDAVSKSGRRGLGLRVVRELVAASGGELRCRSAEGRGTIVEIAWLAIEAADASFHSVGEFSPGAGRRKQVAGVQASRGAWNGTLGGTVDGLAAAAGRVSC